MSPRTLYYTVIGMTFLALYTGGWLP